MWISEFFCQGRWSLFNPPAQPEGQYHFVKLNKFGKMYSPFSLLAHLLFFCPSSYFEAFGEEVRAPEAMEVIAVENSFASKAYFNFFLDLLFRKKNQSGNYVELRNSTGTELRLKHLQSDIPVSVGQKLKKGDLIGKIGSSGGLHLPGLGVELKGGGSGQFQLLQVKLKNAESPSLYRPQQSKSFLVGPQESK